MKYQVIKLLGLLVLFGLLVFAVSADPLFRVEPESSTVPVAVDTCGVDDLAVKLSAIKPFPKIHFSYPLKSGIRSTPRVLIEYVRITNACALGIGVPDSWVEQCVAACVNAGERCTITVNYSPLKNADRGRLMVFDDVFLQEVSRFRARLVSIVERAKPVKVGAVILEHETYWPPGDDDTFDVLALSVKLNTFVFVAMDVIPGVMIHYYNARSRRETWPGDSADGWTEFLPVPENLVISHFAGMSGYWPTELYHFREAVRRSSTTSEVLVWLSLASGWERTPEDKPRSRTWRMDYDYPTGYDWQRGAEMHQTYYGLYPDVYTPGKLVAGVVFWPSAGDERVRCWWKHFLVYARGVHGIRGPPR